MELQDINTSPTTSKDQIVTSIREYLQSRGYKFADVDVERPWGGYFRVSDDQLEQFLKEFFPDTHVSTFDSATLSPKILIVAPHLQLSWQVHQRRREYWRVLKDPVAVYLSPTDQLPDKPSIYRKGEIIDMPDGTRHRLVGLDNWGLVAEIWIHNDPSQPSIETDIRRISDDFGRR